MCYAGKRKTVTAAIEESSSFEPVESQAEADLVLVDAPGFDTDEEFADLTATLDDRSVPRIVLSVPGVDTAQPASFGATVARREAAAVAGADRWCVLRCAPFGQELAWNCRYETAGALYTAWQPDGAPWVDVHDVLDVVGRLMAEPRRWSNAYEVTGPSVVPVSEACEVLRALHDRPMLYVWIEEDVLCSAMRQVGFDPAYAERLANYMVWTTSGPCRTVSSMVEQALGRPPRALEDYLVTTARSYVAQPA